MAIPSYTTDLVDWIADNDTTAWGELTGATSGGSLMKQTLNLLFKEQILVPKV